MTRTTQGENRPTSAPAVCSRCQNQDDPRDDLETLVHCLDAVADLLAPETDLHVVDRDNLATLLGYLVRQQRLALAADQEA